MPVIPYIPYIYPKVGLVYINKGVPCTCGHAWCEHDYLSCHLCGTTDCFPYQTTKPDGDEPPPVKTGLMEWVMASDGASAAAAEYSTPLTGYYWGQPVVHYTHLGWPIGIGPAIAANNHDLSPPPSVPTILPVSGSNYIGTVAGLDKELLLPQACADFYTLLWLDMAGVDAANEKLHGLIGYLCAQLGRYIGMACLGELRHMPRTTDNYYAWWGQAPLVYREILTVLLSHAEPPPPPDEDALCNECDEPWYPCSDCGVCSECHSDSSEPTSGAVTLPTKTERVEVWDKLDEAVAKFGTDLFKHVGDMFRNGGWSVSYGGKKWATCADMLYEYQSGSITGLMFVDQAFGLQHNGDIVFNKFWNLGGLRQIMDWHQAENWQEVTKYTSEGVKKLYEEWRQAGGKHDNEHD